MTQQIQDMPKDARVVADLGSAGLAFFGGFRRLREVQRRAARPILEGCNTLVASATASGKTEAVLAPLLARAKSLGVSSADTTRLLVIAPTRALVNDLAARIEGPLMRMGLQCGRQTSDHRDKSKRPFLLITTPESFDSMLVRDGCMEGSRLVGHLLAGVCAVFVDEVHLFDGTARGDQVCWLLGRLRRLKQFTADHDPQDDGKLQICAASATVSDPDALARRLLGPGAFVVRVPGTREIEVLGPSGAPSWFALEPDLAVSMLRERLEVVPSADLDNHVGRRLWQALANSDAEPMRKVLMFVPTRRLCDTLSAALSRTLPNRRNMQVLAHHGSLDRLRREHAEDTFSSARDAVLVATTTLEVGVDIGDVDLVALVGAPPGTRSLLQRVGRAGRRIGRTRILPLPRSEAECAAFTSMLISARDGKLEPESYARRWSVFVQQAASFVAQGGSRGRRRTDIVDLATEVWPETSSCSAVETLEALIESGCLEEQRGRLSLGEPWADAFDRGSGGMHANLNSSAAGVPVVDSSTGQVIAHVAERPAGNKGLALGGQVWDARVVDGEVLLSARGGGRTREGFRYASRSAPTGLEFAMHVRRGLELAEIDAPMISIDGERLWLHFGGSAYQTLITKLLPSLRPVSSLAGLAVHGAPSMEQLNDVAAREAELRELVDSIFESLEPTLAPGPYQRNLPPTCRKRVVAELFDLQKFRGWLFSRRVLELASADPRARVIRTALGCDPLV